MNRSLSLLLFFCGIFFAVGYAMSQLPSELFIGQGSVISVILISLPAFFGLYKLYGRKALYTIVALGVFALLIETIGIHTGFPYSYFEYTSPIGTKILGMTPWTVFIAWTPLVIGALVLAQRQFSTWWSQFLIYLGLLVASDVVLDPGAVARGLWTYTNGGSFYGVPLQNFLGWIFSGTIAYIIFMLITKKKLPQQISRTTNSIIASSSLILSLALWSGVNAGYQQYLPMYIGIILVCLMNAMLHKHATLLQQEPSGQNKE